MSSEEDIAPGGQEDPDGEPPKRSAGSDLIIPVVAVLFTLYYFSTIIHSPWTAQVSAFFDGTVLILLCTIFIVKTVFALRQGAARLDFRRLLEPAGFTGKRLALLGLTIAYIYIIHWAGFTLTTFTFLSLGMLMLNNGRNKWLIFALSGVMSLGGWALFIYAFKVRFPQGAFEHLMRGILP